MEVSLWGRQQKTIAGQVQKTRSISEYVPAVSKGQSCSGEVKAGAVPHIPLASSSDKLPGEQSHLLLWKPGVRSSTERKAAGATALYQGFQASVPRVVALPRLSGMFQYLFFCIYFVIQLQPASLMGE